MATSPSIFSKLINVLLGRKTSEKQAHKGKSEKAKPQPPEVTVYGEIPAQDKAHPSWEDNKENIWNEQEMERELADKEKTVSDSWENPAEEDDENILYASLPTFERGADEFEKKTKKTAEEKVTYARIPSDFEMQKGTPAPPPQSTNPPATPPNRRASAVSRPQPATPSQVALKEPYDSLADTAKFRVIQQALATSSGQNPFIDQPAPALKLLYSDLSDFTDSSHKELLKKVTEAISNTQFSELYDSNNPQNNHEVRQLFIQELLDNKNDPTKMATLLQTQDNPSLEKLEQYCEEKAPAVQAQGDSSFSELNKIVTGIKQSQEQQSQYGKSPSPGGFSSP